MILEEGGQTVDHHLARVFAAHRQLSLAFQRHVLTVAIQQVGDLLLDVVERAFLDDQHGILAFAEVQIWLSTSG